MIGEGTCFASARVLPFSTTPTCLVPFRSDTVSIFKRAMVKSQTIRGVCGGGGGGARPCKGLLSEAPEPFFDDFVCIFFVMNH